MCIVSDFTTRTTLFNTIKSDFQKYRDTMDLYEENLRMDAFLYGFDPETDWTQSDIDSYDEEWQIKTLQQDLKDKFQETNNWKDKYEIEGQVGDFFLGYDYNYYYLFKGDVEYNLLKLTEGIYENYLGKSRDSIIVNFIEVISAKLLKFRNKTCLIYAKFQSGIFGFYNPHKGTWLFLSKILSRLKVFDDGTCIFEFNEKYRILNLLFSNNSPQEFSSFFVSSQYYKLIKYVGYDLFFANKSGSGVLINDFGKELFISQYDDCTIWGDKLFFSTRGQQKSVKTINFWTRYGTEDSYVEKIYNNSWYVYDFSLNKIIEYDLFTTWRSGYGYGLVKNDEEVHILYMGNFLFKVKAHHVDEITYLYEDELINYFVLSKGPNRCLINSTNTLVVDWGNYESIRFESTKKYLFLRCGNKDSHTFFNIEGKKMFEIHNCNFDRFNDLEIDGAHLVKYFSKGDRERFGIINLLTNKSILSPGASKVVDFWRKAIILSSQNLSAWGKTYSVMNFEGKVITEKLEVFQIDDRYGLFGIKVETSGKEEGFWIFKKLVRVYRFEIVFVDQNLAVSKMGVDRHLSLQDKGELSRRRNSTTNVWEKALELRDLKKFILEKLNAWEGSYFGDRYGIRIINNDLIISLYGF